MTDFKFLEIKQGEFDNFRDSISKASFQQTGNMGKLLKSRGYQVHYFAGLVKDEIQIAALVSQIKIFGGFRYELNFGPISKSGIEDNIWLKFVNEIQKFVKKSNGLYLLVKPDLDYEIYNDNFEIQATENQNILNSLPSLKFIKLNPSRINLEGDGDFGWHYRKSIEHLADNKALFKSYSKDGQYSIKKTQQFGITVRPLAYNELSEFKKITEATSERRDFSDHDLAYYELFYKSFAEKAKFLVAEINFQTYVTALKDQITKLQAQIDKSESAKKQKQREEWQSQIHSQEKRLTEISPFLEKYQDQAVILAAALFVESGDELVYFSSGSFEEFKALQAPFALQYEAMSEALAKNKVTYNFYGVTGQFDGSDGVLRFKQKFSGYLAKKLGVFLYAPNPIKYNAIRLLKKALKR
ncbi:MAG: aminoacyltransferase [Streptococcaceae bacterium]|jgi:alanine adding enzyme|nr:aminoacyltransferase [Streptococcaceae bacterium]